MEKEAYEELRDLVQIRLSSVCNPDNSHYIVIGQSATPVLAFLQNAGHPAAGDLPLTYAANVYAAVKRDDTARALVFAHFDRFLPSPEQLGGRQLCVSDFMDTGASMRAVFLLLTRYYADRFDKDVGFKIVAFVDGDVESPYVDSHLRMASYRSLPLAMNFGFDGSSPHGTWFPAAAAPEGGGLKGRPATEPAAREYTAGYLKFRENLAAQMRADPSVRRFGCATQLKSP